MIFEYSEIEALFWKSIKPHKRGFKVIITKGSPYKTFSFTDKNGHFDLIEVFKFFTILKRAYFLFLPKRHFYKNQSINMGRIAIG